MGLGLAFNSYGFDLWVRFLGSIFGFDFWVRLLGSVFRFDFWVRLEALNVGFDLAFDLCFDSCFDFGFDFWFDFRSRELMYCNTQTTKRKKRTKNRTQN